MSWPTPQDYNEAIQSPHLCFADSDLAKGSVETNALGLPKAATGAFASVYKVTTPAGKWAVRCFLTARLDQEERYKLISEYVLFDDLECTIDFHYLDHGIKVAGQWYPLVKMPWIEGPTLDVYLHEIDGKKDKLLQLRNNFRVLSMELEEAGIAHGDLQHGNILVSPEGLRLVDYDALYVPSLAGRLNLEFGHLNYQHPCRDEFNFDETVDNFSSWLIYFSLTVLSIDPNVFHQFDGGDDCIIFKRMDLLSPEKSKLFEHLLNHESPEIQEMGNLLIRMLWLPPHLVPPLDATPEMIANLPYEKAEALEIARTLASPELNEELIARTLQQKQSAGNRELISRKKSRSPLINLGKVTGDLLSNALKSISPGLWVSMKNSSARALQEQGRLDEALDSLKAIHDLVSLVYPNDKSLELATLIKLANCSLLADKHKQFENYCIAITQLASSNARLMEKALSRIGADSRLLDFHCANMRFFALLSRRGEKNPGEIQSAFRELLDITSHIRSSVETSRVMTEILELFGTLTSSPLGDKSKEELAVTANVLIVHQMMWVKANQKGVHLQDFKANWEAQKRCSCAVLALLDSRELDLEHQLIVKTLEQEPEVSSQFIDECLQDEHLFLALIQKLVKELGMPLALKGLVPSLRFLAKESNEHYIQAVDGLWEIVLNCDGTSLANKFELFAYCNNAARETVINDSRHMTVVLREVREDFAYPDRYERIQATISAAMKLGMPAHGAVQQILKKMIDLTIANKAELGFIDFLKARVTVMDYTSAVVLLPGDKQFTESVKKLEKVIKEFQGSALDK